MNNERAWRIGTTLVLVLAATAVDVRGQTAAQGPMAFRAAHVAPAGTGSAPATRMFGSAMSEDLNRGTFGGLKSALPVVPEMSRQAANRLKWQELVEGLTSNDAVFEVVIGQGRILTLKTDLSGAGRIQPLVAVGNPAVVDFRVVGPRQLRIIGQTLGQTDIAITTATEETVCLEVRVVIDLTRLRVQLAASFPDASLNLAEIGGTILVEGEARDAQQVQAILDAIRGYMAALLSFSGGGSGTSGNERGAGDSGDETYETTVSSDPTGVDTNVDDREILQIINLLRVPGPRQVLLKVQIAELNRTALREIGQSLDVGVGGNTNLVTDVLNTIQNSPLSAGAGATLSAIPIIDNVTLNYALNCLKGNGVLKILAEPNLIALDGHEASFQSGGRFPVPVPQSTGGAGGTITIEWENFGVLLRFIPYILDGGMIRLAVNPEVSTIDQRNQVELDGFEIPALSTRTANTVVELRQGESLAIAGLLSFETEGSTRGIPYLGDMPLLGAFFRSASSEQREKELIVLVTPYLVEPVKEGESPPLPGEEVDAPNDLELYLFGRIESRTLHKYRPTTRTYERGCPAPFQLEGQYIQGEQGFVQ